MNGGSQICENDTEYRRKAGNRIKQIITGQANTDSHMEKPKTNLCKGYSIICWQIWAKPLLFWIKLKIIETVTRETLETLHRLKEVKESLKKINTSTLTS